MDTGAVLLKQEYLLQKIIHVIEISFVSSRQPATINIVRTCHKEICQFIHYLPYSILRILYEWSCLLGPVLQLK